MVIRRGVGLAVDNWFDDNLDRVVGDGGNIFCLLDAWLGVPLCNRFKRSFDLAKNRLLSVAR